MDGYEDNKFSFDNNEENVKIKEILDDNNFIDK